MTDGPSFVDSVFEWFTDVPSTAPDASRLRALAWLKTPNARVVATRLTFGVGSPEGLLVRATTAIESSEHLPSWQDPTDAEEHLRVLLDRLTPTVDPDNGASADAK